VPDRFLAEGLIDALADLPLRRALLARAAGGRDVLPEALRQRGIEVDDVALYETVAEPLRPGDLQEVERADYVTFTSSSTVRFFLSSAAERISARTRIISIGPVTSAALRERGLEPHVEASRHDIEGLVEALVLDAEDLRGALRA
jgi:uroporphyrinogen III methyltransferase/synthase